MYKRKWYEKDIETTLLGFGAMRLTTTNGEIDEEKGFELFDLAIKNGVNYFDTALPYTSGKNETFVGKALKRYPRESFYLASKLSLFCFKTKEEALKSIDIQLEALQTDYIDFYLIHALDKKVFARFKEWNMLEVVEEWKKQGKIKHIGFSFHDSYDVFKEILDYYDWEFAQIQLNYMDQNIQQGWNGYNDLVKRKIPIVVMEPVKGGRLAKFNEKVSQNFKNYSDASLASWALRWVGSLDGVKVILSGMNEKEQMIDNINTFKEFKPLNDEEKSIVDKVIKELTTIDKVGCTKCKYCLPCPKGVLIPNIFSVYNNYAMYESKENAKWEYDSLVRNKADISQCVKCGLCVSKCPQGIKVPEVFDKMLDELKFLKD